MFIAKTAASDCFVSYSNLPKNVYIYTYNIYKFLRFGAINDTSDVPISVVSRLSFRCCLFSGLAMGPSMATLALAANWNYFEISLTGAACALLSAALSAFALRDVPHASGTWEKAKRKHHRRTDAQINVEDKGKRVQTHPKHVFHPKNTFPKTKKHKHNNLRICISKKNADLPCWFFEASRGPETMPSSGSCTSRSRETRTNPPKILMFRWFWRVFLCFVDFVCFLCVFLCFLWFLDFHRQLQMRVVLLVLEEVKWRGLAAWAYKKLASFFRCSWFFCVAQKCSLMHFVALLSPLSVMQNLEIGQASRTWQLQSSGDCQHLKFSGWSILCFHWDSAVLSELISNTGMSLSFPIVFTSLQLCPEIFGTNPGGAGYSADLQQSSCCHDSSTLILVTSLERFLNLSFARCFVGSGFRWWNWIWRSLTAKFQNGRFWFCFYSFCTAKALALGHIWLKIRMVWHKVFYTDVAAELCGDTEELDGPAMHSYHESFHHMII